MATRDNLKTYENSSDSNFRSWAKEISDALLAFGWVKTADTGQLDWNTIVRPSSANSYTGYEIFRMADALQSTAPCFLKIEYGSGSSNALHPAIAIQIGTATTGAGVLAGNTSNRQTLISGGNTATLVTIRTSGDTNRFSATLASDYNNATNSISFCIERSYTPVSSPSAAHTDTDEYILQAYCTSALKGSQIVPKTGGGAVPNPRLFQSLVGDDGTTVSGVAPSYCALYPFMGRPRNPLRGLAMYMNAEMTAQGTDAGDFFGVPLNFFRLGGSLASIIAAPSTPAANSRLAVRFD
jgi:hypothetical protein